MSFQGSTSFFLRELGIQDQPITCDCLVTKSVSLHSVSLYRVLTVYKFRSYYVKSHKHEKYENT